VAVANTSGRVNEDCQKTVCIFACIVRESRCVCVSFCEFSGLCVLVEAS